LLFCSSHNKATKTDLYNIVIIIDGVIREVPDGPTFSLSDGRFTSFTGGSTSSRNAAPDSSNNMNCVGGNGNTHCKGCAGGNSNYACTDCSGGNSNKGCQDCSGGNGNIGSIDASGGNGNIGCRDTSGGDNNIASVGLTGGNNNVLSESLVGCSDCELSSDCKYVKGRPGKKYSGIHLKGANSSYGRHGGSYGGNMFPGNDVVFSSGGSARALTPAEERQYTASGHMRDQTAAEIERVAAAKTHARNACGKRGTRESWKEFLALVPRKSELAWSASEGVEEAERFSDFGKLGLLQE